jgi:hypothetical protein
VTPELQLIFGCFLLGAVVAYAWWTRLRIYYFQLDLIDIVSSLLDGPSATTHPLRVALAETIMILVRHPDLVNPSGLLELSRAAGTGESEKGSGFIGSWMSLVRSHLSEKDRPDEIESALVKLIGRTSNFMFGETISGWTYLIFPLITGRLNLTLGRLARAIRLIPNSWELRRINLLLSPDGPRT